MDKPIIFYEVRPQVNRSRTRLGQEVQRDRRAHRPERRHAHFRAEGRYGQVCELRTRRLLLRAIWVYGGLPNDKKPPSQPYQWI